MCDGLFSTIFAPLDFYDNNYSAEDTVQEARIQGILISSMIDLLIKLQCLSRVVGTSGGAFEMPWLLLLAGLLMG